MIDIQDMKAGHVYIIDGKAYGICSNCRSLVRVDKPIFGSLHYCA